MSSSSEEEDIAAEAFAKEALSLDADKQTEDERSVKHNNEQYIAVNNRRSSTAAMDQKTPKEEAIGNLKRSVEASNNNKDYSLPTSNLPLKFRLDSSSSSSSSSRHQLLQQIQEGNWMNGSSLGKTNWSNWQLYPQMTSHEASLLGSQELGYQALLNQVMAPSRTFPLNVDDGLTPADHQFQAAAKMPLNQGLGSSTMAMGETIPFQYDVLPNPNKRKMSWQDDTPKTIPTELPLLKWDSPAHANQGQLDSSAPTVSGSRPKIMDNKVYDPSYEEMGLPIDPHLRLFLARREKEEDKDKDNEQEKGEGSTGSKTKSH